MKLSLCMIVKDEESVIARCLQSVGDLCDEIIVVDTGSQDNTIQIARNSGANVYSFPWQYDFSAARNYSFSLASCDYILWLDADDILSKENYSKLMDLKRQLDGSVDTYFLRYDAAFDSFHNPTLSFYRERIVRRAANFLWTGAVHECIAVNSNIRRCDIAITHLRSNHSRRGRNLFLFAHSFAHGTIPDERQKYYFARELFDNGLYETAASVFENFLLGNGWQEDKIHACRALALCYKCLGLPQKQLDSLFKSFEFAPPRSEICCDIGELFVQKKNWNQAIFWYKLALNEQSCDGFTYPDCRGFLPCIWLSVCYDRLGDPVKANAYNEQAGRYKPLDKSFLHNRQYFHSILHKKGDTL